MLSDFAIENKQRISARAGALIVGRASPEAAAAVAEATSVSCEQLVAVLRSSGPAASALPLSPEVEPDISFSAGRYGHEALRAGSTIETLIQSYGCIREALIGLVQEAGLTIEASESMLFERCLELAVIAAVTAYTEQRERDLAYEGTERLGVLAHEMRNLLNTLTLSFALIREGKVGVAGSTGAMLSRSLSGLCALVDRSVAEVRLKTSPPQLSPVSMLDFIREVQVSAAVHAEGYGMQLTVHPVDRELLVDADWQLLASSVSNLLQNAFKFSRPRGQVALVTRVTADRVLIDVCDECGGLPPGSAESLFLPFSRVGPDRSGLGLGLYIAQGAARANRGEIRVQNIPGTGCVFTVDMPRSAPSEQSH